MKMWAWVLLGGGAFTVVAGYLASRAQASSGSIGGFTVPPGTQLSATERAVLAAIPTDPATPGRVHHDFQKALDLYLQNRMSDGSATINGTRYANLSALMQAALQG